MGTQGREEGVEEGDQEGCCAEGCTPAQEAAQEGAIPGRDSPRDVLRVCQDLCEEGRLPPVEGREGCFQAHHGRLHQMRQGGVEAVQGPPRRSRARLRQDPVLDYRRSFAVSRVGACSPPAVNVVEGTLKRNYPAWY